MRTLVSLTLISMLATPVLANGVALGPIAPSAVPPPCRDVARVFANADSQLAARVSVASCAASLRMDAQQITDSPASVVALDMAVAQSMAMLDEVIQNGDAGWKIIAEQAKGDLYIAMMVRMRNAIPSLDPSKAGAPLAEIEQRHHDLEPQLVPWLDQADRAFEQVALIARANPQMAARDPVVRNAVEASRIEHTGGVASR